MRRILWFCMPVALLFVLFAGTATAKTAAGPVCGATIKKSIKLTANLDCSGGGTDGLVVGRNGIVINLNGHTITGSGGAAHYYGIYNDGRSNVTVENGTIKNFEYDFYSEYARKEMVTKVTFVLDGTHSYEGLYAEYGGDNTFSHDTVTNADDGFETYSEAGDTFMHNSLTHNQYAVYEEYSQHQTWMANSFSHSSDEGYYEDYSSPILIGNVSSHDGDEGFYLYCDGYGYAVVKNNTATNDALSGIYSYECYSDGYQTSTFSGNTTSHDEYGIYSDYDWKAKMSGNTADNNSSYGFYLYEPVGYLFTKNTSNENDSSGVYLYTDAYYYPILFAKNSSSKNHSHGFEADYAVYGTGDSGTGNTSSLLYNVSG